MILKPTPPHPELDELLRRAVEKYAAMTPAEREAMHKAQCESWVRGEMAMGSDANEDEYRRKIEKVDE